MVVTWAQGGAPTTRPAGGQLPSAGCTLDGRTHSYPEAPSLGPGKGQRGATEEAGSRVPPTWYKSCEQCPHVWSLSCAPHRVPRKPSECVSSLKPLGSLKRWFYCPQRPLKVDKLQSVGKSFAKILWLVTVSKDASPRCYSEPPRFPTVLLRHCLILAARLWAGHRALLHLGVLALHPCLAGCWDLPGDLSIRHFSRRPERGQLSSHRSCVTARAAVTKCRRPGGLPSRNVFSQS